MLNRGMITKIRLIGAEVALLRSTGVPVPVMFYGLFTHNLHLEDILPRISIRISREKYWRKFANFRKRVLVPNDLYQRALRS